MTIEAVWNAALATKVKTPVMTPARVTETAKQFGQKVTKREAKVIAALLKGRK